jgi:hypothetical protein
LPIIKKALNLSLCIAVALVGEWVDVLASNGSMANPTVMVKDIISDVLSRDCERRYGAVTALIKNANSDQLSSLQKEIGRENRQAAIYLREVFKFIDAQEHASRLSQELVKQGLAEATVQIPDTPENQAKIASFLASFLVSKIQDESSLNQSFVLWYIASQAKHYSPGSES